ncbi:MAG: M23 family metallopeptidase [Prolixibacteraceae bacterium]|jgi:murein DD-endopeptidase MepM/ murein hydrolase activator NlpD|nr:M23 family metallopeptidase [Prolixibacteraceae bacterium]
MGNTKYQFNPESLKYEKVEKSLSTRLFRFLGFAILTLIVAGSISMFFLSHLETPGMKALLEENKQLINKYEILNTKLKDLEVVLDEIQLRDDNIYRVVFNSDPIPESVRKAGFGGTDAYSDLSSLKNSDLVLNTTRKIDIISKQAYIQAKSYEDVLKIAIDKEKELAGIPAIMPIFNNDLSYISSGWGMRTHPIYNVRKFHFGMDFVAQSGTNIYATGAGKVTAVRTHRNGHGKHVIIDHGYGYETLYAHMSEFNVKVGDSVSRGQVIGFVGTTGTSTAPHLHYEVHKNGKNVDPKYYYFKDLSPQKFEELVAISENVNVSFD